MSDGTEWMLEYGKTVILAAALFAGLVVVGDSIRRHHCGVILTGNTFNGFAPIEPPDPIKKDGGT